MIILFFAALGIAVGFAVAIAALLALAPILYPWIYDRLALPAAERTGSMWDGWRLGLLLLLLNKRWAILNWYASIMIVLTLGFTYIMNQERSASLPAAMVHPATN